MSYKNLGRMAKTYEKQKLTSFVVQIRHRVRNRKISKVVGTGFTVSPNGLIVTCAHVVTQAGIDPRSGRPVPISVEERLRHSAGLAIDVPNPALWVRFIQIAELDQDEGYRLARISKFNREYADDVVLLQLEGDLPIGIGYARIGRAGPTIDKPTKDDRFFISFGYRRVAKYLGLNAEGHIIGFADKPEKVSPFDEPVVPLLHRPVQLESQNINGGMSGAPILDIKRDLVVGIITEKWNAWGESFADRDTSFATDAEILRALSVKLHEDELEPEPAYANEADSAESKFNNSNSPIIFFGSEPIASLESSGGHERVCERIQQVWSNIEYSVCILEEDAGRFRYPILESLEVLINSHSVFQPKKTFWLNLREQDNSEAFFDFILAPFLRDDLIKPNELPSSVKPTLIQTFLKANSHLIIIDGFNRSSTSSLHRYIGSFIADMEREGHKSLCLVIPLIP